MSTQIGFNSIPDDNLETISGMIGMSIGTSRHSQISADKIPYKEVFKSFRNFMGRDKCDALVHDLTVTRMLPFNATRNLSDGQKLRSICKDLLNQCKQLKERIPYLASLKLSPIYSASKYAEIQEWIADENILLVGSRLLGEEYANIRGEHQQRASIVREMLAKRKDEFIEIDLSNLGLTQMPPEIFTFINLNTIDLSENKISQFDVRWNIFPLLEHLSLRDNPLKSFEYEVATFPTLYELSLSGTRLVSFTARSNAFPRLRYLHIRDLQAKSFIVESIAFPMLREIEGNENTEIGSFVIATDGFITLTNLHLTGLTVKKIDIQARAFPAVTNFQFPSRTGTINIGSGAFPNLSELVLKDCQIERFLVATNAFPLVNKLFYKDTRIGKFELATQSFPLLTEFRLRNAHIGTFNVATRGFPLLTKLVGEEAEDYEHIPTFGNLFIASEAFPSLRELDIRILSIIQIAKRAFPVVVKQTIYV